MSHEPDLREVEFRLLRDLVHETYGVFLKDDRIQFVRTRLGARLHLLGLRSFTEYHRLLKYGQDAAKELSHAISLLTNNETYFFREMAQLEAFGEHVLPQLHRKVAQEGRKGLRLCSAGCSTGEEAYTVAMLVLSTGHFLPDWDIRIVGLDVNESVLRVAREGRYYARSMRAPEAARYRSYFAEVGGAMEVKPLVRRMTTFAFANLSDAESIGAPETYDAIFCRNVLIYFSRPMMQKAIDNLHRALRRGGWLLLGHSETLVDVAHSFETVRLPGAIAYRK